MLGIGDDLLCTLAHLHEGRVICVYEEYAPSTTHAVIELSLGLAHSLERAKALKVCFTDIGDESVVGLSDGTELRYIPRLARSHLDECKLMLGS